MSCDEGSRKERSLLIAGAANMQYVLEELIRVFEDSTGIECDLVISSSGKLAAQISEGAQYDIFLSADQSYPSFLQEKGLIRGKVAEYAKGRLLLWSNKEVFSNSIKTLLLESDGKIAIANPDIAPYGRAAMQVFKSLSIDQEISNRLVFGESVAQVNQFVRTGSATFGITGQGIIKFLEGEDEHYLYLDDNLYQPIIQEMVILKNASEKAETFSKFLLSDQGKAILQDFGYLIN